MTTAEEEFDLENDRIIRTTVHMLWISRRHGDTKKSLVPVDVAEHSVSLRLCEKPSWRSIAPLGRW